MQVIKWIGFILLCGDVLAYIVNHSRNNLKNFAGFLGLGVGTATRIFVLYGALTCWILE